PPLAPTAHAARDKDPTVRTTPWERTDSPPGCQRPQPGGPGRYSRPPHIRPGPAPPPDRPDRSALPGRSRPRRPPARPGSAPPALRSRSPGIRRPPTRPRSAHTAEVGRHAPARCCSDGPPHTPSDRYPPTTPAPAPAPPAAAPTGRRP